MKELLVYIILVCPLAFATVCCDFWDPDGTLVIWEGTMVTLNSGLIDCPKPPSNCQILSTGETIIRACNSGGSIVMSASMTIINNSSGTKYIFDTRISGNFNVIVRCCQKCQ